MLMSKYTTLVRHICEHKAGYTSQQDSSMINRVIEKSWNRIFDIDIPFYDENERKRICCKILRHYYMREIGFETVGLWEYNLNTRLAEVMPYYNQLYESAKLKFEPLIDTDIERKTDDSSNTTTSTTSNNKNRFSDTPQGGLQDIENNRYLTTAEINDNKGNSDSNYKGTGTVVEKGLNKGKSKSQLLMEYRKTFINIDLKLINEFKDLFMMLW